MDTLFREVLNEDTTRICTKMIISQIYKCTLSLVRCIHNDIVSGTHTRRGRSEEGEGEEMATTVGYEVRRGSHVTLLAVD